MIGETIEMKKTTWFTCFLVIIFHALCIYTILHGHYTRYKYKDPYKDPTFMCIYIYFVDARQDCHGAPSITIMKIKMWPIPFHVLSLTSSWIIEPSLFIWLHFSNFNSNLCSSLDSNFGWCGLAIVRKALGMEWKSFMLGSEAFIKVT